MSGQAEKVTFEINKGLEGVVVAESKIGLIDGMNGKLYYRGYSIEALAERCTYEEIAYLLLYEKLPNVKELKSFGDDLKRHRRMPKHITDMMRTFCKGMTSMEALRTTVSALSCGDPDARKVSTGAHLHNGNSLIAKFPTIVAHYNRIRRNQPVIHPDPRLSHAANFLYMMSGERPDALSERAMDLDLVLHAEHGFNASSFAARVTISTLADMHSALTTGIGTLKGPLHGGAAQAVMQMLNQIKDEKYAEQWVKSALAKHEKVMGFGHRVYKTYDPRARILKKMAKEISGKKKNMRWYLIADKVEEVMGREKNLYPNVDFYSAIVYHNLGLPMDLDSPIFAISRSAGWVAHCIEQYQDNKLIRPREYYTGPKDLEVVPIEKRP
jgi:citrate synthase